MLTLTRSKLMLTIGGALAASVVALLSSVVTAQRGTKVLLVYDMEGVTGAEHAGDYDTPSQNYPKTRQSLTDDVNAAIRGLQKGGAREIVLTDGHASGNTDGPDYIIEQLPKGVRFEMRDAPYDPYVDIADKTFDALAMVGMHVRSGSEGFTPHTYFGMVRWNLNGLEMSETSEVALSAARFGIPLILVTGDDRHKAEVAEFSPKTEYVVVKKAVDNRTAQARPREQVTADIEAAAERGLKSARQIQPYKFDRNLVSDFKFPLAEYTAIASNFPKASIVNDKTIRIASDNYLDALLAYRSISNFMRYATADTLVKAINALPNGPEMVREARAKLPPRNYEPSSNVLHVDNKLDKWGYQ